MTSDPKVLHFLQDAPLFFQPWWLEAVSPGRWDYVVARRGEELAGVLPYTFKLRLGLRLIEMPPLTPYLGPWLRKSNAKYANRLSEEKELMSELISALPRFATFHQQFHPRVTNWLPFHWKGFQQTTYYTYRIEETKDSDRLWAELRENIRTDIKKSEKAVRVEEIDGVAELIRLHKLTFMRQKWKYPYSEEMIQRIDKACSERGLRKILVAVDANGKSHCGGYFVSDGKTVYYLMGGGDPELRSSGATSLLVWKAIQWASDMGVSFDFEGSIVEPIERFFRGFGAIQTPFFKITKENSPAVAMYRWMRSARR